MSFDFAARLWSMIATDLGWPMTNHLLRSLLFVPADSPRKLEKARGLRPDAVILDLEDGVSVENKLRARSLLSAELPNLRKTQSRIFVRVNSLQSSWFAEDLHAAASPGVAGIVLPKVETAAEVSDVDDVLALVEEQKGLPGGGLRLLPSIESASGVLQAGAVARCSSRTLALVFGGEDYCADMGMTRTKSGDELFFARWMISLAARAAGVEAIDTVFTDLNDPSGLIADTRRARQMGFGGRLLIHPGQIDAVHRAFAPDEEAVIWAERVVSAFDEASRQGAAVVVVDGKMVDWPVLLQARRILALRVDPADSATTGSRTLS